MVLSVGLLISVNFYWELFQLNRLELTTEKEKNISIFTIELLKSSKLKKVQTKTIDIFKCICLYKPTHLIYKRVLGNRLLPTIKLLQLKSLKSKIASRKWMTSTKTKSAGASTVCLYFYISSVCVGP
jgi:hypothetical protein